MVEALDRVESLGLLAALGLILVQTRLVPRGQSRSRSEILWAVNLLSSIWFVYEALGCGSVQRLENAVQKL